MLKNGMRSTLRLHEPDYLGLLKVISGGQVGVDQAGIHAAYELGVQTGGTAPLHYRTQFGDNPELGSKYGLVEDASYAYPPRTRRNVAEADATLIIGSNLASPGCTLTSRLAKELKKPCEQFHIDRDMLTAEVLAYAPQIAHWITEGKFIVLNVAGNRDKRGDFFHYTMAHRLITEVLLDLQLGGHLVTKALQ